MTDQNDKVFEFDGVRVEPVEFKVWRGEAELILEPKTLCVLIFLLENRGRLIAKDELLNAIWPDAFVTENAMASEIAKLRKALGDDAKESRYIQTVHTKGYRFVAEVTTTDLRSCTGSESASPGENKPETALALTSVRRGLYLAGAITLVVAAVIGSVAYRRFSTGSTVDQISSIAVMPLVNESGDPELEYLSDGMTETLIKSLSQLPNMNVKARSSVFRYKDKDISDQQVGAYLDVPAILKGRIIQRGESLTLYLSLINVQTGNQIWGEQYNRKFADLVALQHEIGMDVSTKLKTKLSKADEIRLGTGSAANSEAYQLYLKGRFHWNKRTPRDLQKAVEYFQQAVAVDPNYALAFSGLADGYTLLSSFGGAPPREAMPKAKDAALRAMLLDDQLAEPHVAIGYIAQFYEYDFAEAEREYKRSIEMNPNYAIAHEFYGTLLSNIGRYEESEAEFRRALELEPLSLGTNRMYGENFLFARKYDAAIAQLKKVIELDDSVASAHRSLGRVYLMTRNYAGHVEEFARHYEIIGEPQYAALMRESFANGGWKGYLQAMTGEKRPTRYFFPFYLAIYYAELGEKDKAFAELNRTYNDRLYYIAWLKTDPCVDLLRDDQRFQELLRKAGFPE